MPIVTFVQILGWHYNLIVTNNIIKYIIYNTQHIIVGIYV